ncbi:MAG: DNA-processing protein DprA [bacterium]
MIHKKILLLYLWSNLNFFKIRRLLERFGNQDLDKKIDEVYNYANIDQKQDVILGAYNIDYNMIKDRMKVFIDQDFPDYLFESDCGLVFYKGNWDFTDRKYIRVSIVGSRKPLNISSEFVSKLLFYLSDISNIVVVSGLATGIDTIALEQAINNNIGATAILGNGIDYYYPYHNKVLQTNLFKNGLVFSEYPPNHPPRKYYFPYRNRLIAAMSDVVVVVQASEKSGSIITGKYALEMGKTLIVPYLSNTEDFEGSKQLINSGAILISKPQEILNYLPLNFLKSNTKSHMQNLQKTQNYQEYQDEIIKIVRLNPGITLEKIAQITEINLPELIKIVTELELQGKLQLEFDYSLFVIDKNID